MSFRHPVINVSRGDWSVEKEDPVNAFPVRRVRPDSVNRGITTAADSQVQRFEIQVQRMVAPHEVVHDHFIRMIEYFLTARRLAALPNVRLPHLQA